MTETGVGVQDAGLPAMLERAERLARLRHAGQTDKGGAEYWRHPARVSAGCRSGEAKIAGWLHDLLEDTGTTADELLELGFSEAVVRAVELDTRRDGEDYMAYIRAILAACDAADPATRHAGRIAREVKMSDLRDNMDLTRLTVVREADRRREAKYRRAYALLAAWPGRA
ncbi:guanosine-3',5'-bis(diphosphate) 3'-pyrophosphohydrolase [Bifidobacterium sp. DSM 109960]|uniref:Guanosine-3',5'-bis(Diphosphate) 3'-pyrophosphohydrolase n=1 Tax=Bifidobacterium erythrocebi TaxID=2675325 RepID=A0A7Y0ET96_9BIFI|nr:phosphohydrolase [Bifidobacterium sp. DSM 109960]NMM96005.1 guanosine-3',5'-bis(diphosphate) 3'-pyrophosphohydrolase [Bifidobacterium sp. DSM 109960]